jgi:DNA-binding transcriptional LysR family regulator
MHLRACRQIGGFEPDIRYTSDDFLILLEMVRTTGAGALLPDLVVGFEAPGVVVRAFESGGVGREVFLLTRRTRTPTVEAVTMQLREAAEDAAARAGRQPLS